MTLASQTITISNKIPNVAAIDSVPLVLGVGSLAGTTVTAYESIPALIAGEGYGSGPELAAQILTQTGRVIYAGVVGTENGTNPTTLTKVGSGAAIAVAVAAAPYDNYRFKMVILTGGSETAAKFKYSLDDGRNYSGETAMAGTTTIPNSGLVLTCSGTYVAGDTYDGDFVAPDMAAAEVANAIARVNASNYRYDFDWVAFAGSSTVVANAALLSAAAATAASAWVTAGVPVGIILDAGSGDTAANVAGGYSPVNDYILPAYGYAWCASAIPLTGYGSCYAPVSYQAAKKAAGELISTPLSRVKSGPLDLPEPSSQYGNTTNVAAADAATLDAKGIVTLKRVPGKTGYFLSNDCLKGTSITDWHTRRVVDEIFKTCHTMQTDLFDRTMRVVGGKYDKAEILDFQNTVQGVLEAQFGGDSGGVRGPTNAEGTKGHVSSISYVIDQAASNPITKTIVARCSVVPRMAIKTIQLTIEVTL